MPDERGSKFVIGATWDDVPHLDEATKAELLASIPAYQRDARTKGIPQLGSGAIYPIQEADVTCDPFKIPKHYWRAYGLDTANAGFTAAVWGAVDRDADVVYIYALYKREGAEPAVHVASIKGKGAWIPGVGDAAAVTNADGEQYIQTYKRLGLDLELADKSVEAGILDVYERMTTGRFKVFAHLTEWFEEFRLYRRDERGRIVKQHDHCMDSTRYLVRSGLRRAKQEPGPKKNQTRWDGSGEAGWMGV